METHKTPPVIDPGVDVAVLLAHYMGDTGKLEEAMGGFRIKVCHTRAFPWDDVFKTLVYREFKVTVTHHKADLIIEAQV